MTNHTQITDTQVEEWAQVLTPQEILDLSNGINITAAMIMYKLFPNNQFIKELLKTKIG